MSEGKKRQPVIDWKAVDWRAIASGGFALFLILVVVLPAFNALTPKRSHPPADRETISAIGHVQNQECEKQTFWGRTTCDPVAGFTAFLALFSGLLAVVSFVQIKYLVRADVNARRSLLETRKASARQFRQSQILLSQSGTQAQAALEQARAAYSQVAVTKDDSERQLRAYVSVTVREVKDLGGSHPVAEVQIFNSGRTPAYDAVWKGCFYFERWPLLEGFEFPSMAQPIESVTTVQPRQGGTAPLISETPFDDVYIKYARMGHVEGVSGELRLYVMGILRYRDAFGKLRWTRICVSIPPHNFDAMLKAAENGQPVPRPIFDHALRYNDAT